MNETREQTRQVDRPRCRDNNITPEAQLVEQCKDVAGIEVPLQDLIYV